MTSTNDEAGPSAKKRKLSISEMSSSSIELAVVRFENDLLKQFVKKLEAEKVQHVNVNNEKKILELEGTVKYLQAVNEEEKRQRAKMDLIVKEGVAKIQAYEDDKRKSEAKIKELNDQIASIKSIKRKEALQRLTRSIGQPITAVGDAMVTLLLRLFTDRDFRHVIKMKPTDRFDNIFLDYGAKAGYSKPEDLQLLWDTGFEYKNVKYFDTPAKLEMYGSVTLLFIPRPGAKREIRKDGEMKIKINTKDQKEPLERFIHKEMQFGDFKVKLCAELNINPSKARFTFDGDEVSDDDTPDDWDLEELDCLDMFVSS